MAENHHFDAEPPPPAAGRDLSRWAAALLLSAVVICFYWRLVFTNQFTWLAGEDTAAQVLPWMQYQAGEWKAGRIPLWDPNTWMGQPLLGQAQPGVVYPLNWLLYALPLRDGWLKQAWLHWYFVSIHLMAAWFAYLLARQLGCRRWPAVFGGAAFSLSGWLGTNEWPQMINGAVWAPLVFLYILRAKQAGRRGWAAAALGGFFLGMAWLSGHHQIPIFISLAAAAVWCWRLAQSGRKWHAVVLAMALFWGLALLTGAAQILPAQDYGRESVRWAGAPEPLGWKDPVPYPVHERFGLQPASMLGILFAPLTVHSSPFLGVAAFSLALMGVALGWRRRWTRVMGAVALGGLLYSLANYTPLEGIVYSLLPVVDKARSASMAIFLFGFGGSMLAAIGLDALVDRSRESWVRHTMWGALVLGVVIFVLKLGLAEAKGFPPPGEARVFTTGLAALLLAALLAGWRNGAMRWSALAAGLLGLALVEFSNVNGFHMAHVSYAPNMALLDSMKLHGDIAAFLKKQPGLRRADIDDKSIRYNFGDWYGIETSGGYLASVTENLHRMELHMPAAKRLFGVAYAVGTKPTEFHQEEVFSSKSGLKVYRNEDVLPRAFVVHEVAGLKNPDLAAMTLTQLDHEVGRRAFVVGEAPKAEACAGEEPVRVEQHQPLHVKLRVKLNCAGMVVLGDAYTNGWHATVDGKDARIWQVDGLVRGVVAPGGEHVVEYTYRPTSVVAGGLASLSGLVLACGAWFVRRRSGGDVDDAAFVGSGPDETV